MFVRLRSLVLVALLTAGCSNGGISDPSLVDETDGSQVALGPDDDFCEDANTFITDRSVTDVANFSAEFFAGIDERLADLVQRAPQEVADDFEILRENFALTDQIFAEFDYDVSDERLGPALFEVDNEAMLDATASIQSYLAANCSLDPVASSDPEEVDAIMTAFNVDRPLAECLNLELGDVANIGSEELTPELLTKNVCGTSLFALLSEGGTPEG